MTGQERGNRSAAGNNLILCAVGDAIVSRAKPESAFALAAPVIRQADIAFCQLEQLLSERGHVAVHAGGVPEHLRAHPSTVSAYTSAGFNVISCAGNHCLDWGPEALLDTIETLRKNGIQVIGVGKDISEARRPAIIERKGTKVGFLAYNSILPHRYWAEVGRPGCAPVRVSTLYEAIEHGQPGTPCRTLTFAEREDLKALVEDVRKLRSQVDVVVVSLHWGIHFIPATLALYQKEVGYAAVDAGADLILGHHAHILKGIEVYKGKVITYSLGNFVIDLGPEWLRSPAGKMFMKLYPNLREGDDPEYPTYGFPVDSRKTLILKCVISGKSIQKVTFLPALINKQGQPEVLPQADRRSRDVFEYMDGMCRDLGTRLSFEGDEVRVVIPAV